MRLTALQGFGPIIPLLLNSVLRRNDWLGSKLTVDSVPPGPARPHSIGSGRDSPLLDVERLGRKIGPESLATLCGRNEIDTFCTRMGHSRTNARGRKLSFKKIEQ